MLNIEKIINYCIVLFLLENTGDFTLKITGENLHRRIPCHFHYIFHAHNLYHRNLYFTSYKFSPLPRLISHENTLPFPAPLPIPL